MIKPRVATLVFFGLTLAVVAEPVFADDAKVDDTGGLERYAPAAASRAAHADVGATTANADANASAADLEATRAAVDKRSGSTIQLNVSGWLSQQLQINR